ncbi:hypothetical protein [Rhodopila sp.]|uniref:hypothetical protein n=1 Tax=Rhodopila sp. TaxID=2480087 RepID=UPI002BE71C1E|nr:hypothetical protein [Rhodopila sp.]HVZ08612.1 hypothetical protein [Rhodopila sp.]
MLALPLTEAKAFPFVDPTNQGVGPVPGGTELAAPDAQDLAHQLQLINGPLVAPAGGWAFQPRIDAQFMLTDNVYQVNAPRQWDFVTNFAPGFTLAGDMSHLQTYFTFQPTLSIYANASSLNALTQQYTGTALATLADDLLYLDVRAVSGVNSVYGGLGGLGGVGSTAVAQTSAANINGVGNTMGLNKNSQIQNSSLTISPYLLRRLGDWGTVKLGYSFGLSHSDALTGFVASPFPTGGANQLTYVSNEEYFHYDTGDALSRLQYGFDVDLTQARTITGDTFYETVTGQPQIGIGTGSYNNKNYYVTNRVSYQVNPTIQVFATGGWEYIDYGNSLYKSINGPTWSIGTTLTPGPDTSLTASYGYMNGYYSANVVGYYNVTARTSVNASYTSQLGTQLQYLQSQLNLASGPNMTNAANGGQLFVANNLFGPQPGVYRFDTFNIGAQTTLNRDIISASVSWSKSTQQGVGAAPPSYATSFTLQWIHQLQEDLIMTIAGAFNTSNVSNTLTSFNPGNSHAFIGSAALQYQISPTLGATLRYSFFDRISDVSTYSVYQNLLVLGISKTF